MEIVKNQKLSFYYEPHIRQSSSWLCSDLESMLFSSSGDNGSTGTIGVFSLILFDSVIFFFFKLFFDREFDSINSRFSPQIIHSCLKA